MRARILHLGAILFTSAIPPVEVSERANNDRLVHAVRRDVYLLLVSASLFPAITTKASNILKPEKQYMEQLLQLVPTSRQQTRHHNSQLRAQRFLPDLFHLQSYLRPVSTPHHTKHASYTKSNNTPPPRVISWTGDFKWTAMAGVPIFLLGTALLVPFRAPDTHVGLLTMIQILVGLGSCLFTVCGQLAIMAMVTHQEVAVVIAIWGLFGSIGAAVGSAIAGGMWNNILQKELYNRLPQESKHLAASIFADLVKQISYADGTGERDAIVGAYADVQRKMAIVGVCFVPLCILCTWFWRNVNVKKLQTEQTSGKVW